MVKIAPLAEKINQIESTHKKGYRELEQAINDIDIKTFIISTKQYKEINTINNEISNIRGKKRGKTTNTNLIDFPIVIFKGMEKGEHPRHF